MLAFEGDAVFDGAKKKLLAKRERCLQDGLLPRSKNGGQPLWIEHGEPPCGLPAAWIKPAFNV
jgi:hypothetical protein